MSFAHRRIDVQFQLAQGAFSGGENTLTVSGKRVSASIAKSGGVSLTSLDLKVYGLTMDVMNALTTLGKPLPSVRKNIVTVSAGDDSGVAVVFAGVIQSAWADLQAAPDGVFVAQAATGLLDLLRPVPPTSFRGSVDVATVMAGLAKLMNLNFENAGVSIQLASPYFAGTAVDQAQRCAQAANINMIIEADTLAIWPKGGVRKAAATVVSPSTGLIGYPAWIAQGVSLSMLFNPTITYGGTIMVQDSLITPANGPWSPFSVSHEIESETPGGRWLTKAECAIFGTVALAN